MNQEKRSELEKCPERRFDPWKWRRRENESNGEQAVNRTVTRVVASVLTIGFLAMTFPLGADERAAQFSSDPPPKFPAGINGLVWDHGRLEPDWLSLAPEFDPALRHFRVSDLPEFPIEFWIKTTPRAKDQIVLAVGEAYESPGKRLLDMLVNGRVCAARIDLVSLSQSPARSAVRTEGSGGPHPRPGRAGHLLCQPPTDLARRPLSQAHLRHAAQPAPKGYPAALAQG